MDLELRWYLIPGNSDDKRALMGSSEFDLTEVAADASDETLRSILTVGMNHGMASYLTWLFNRPNEQVQRQVEIHAKKLKLKPSQKILSTNAAAFQFLQRS